MLHKIGVAALLSGIIAQALKPFISLIKRRGFRVLSMLNTGGMPSSHTAVVTTLTVGVAVYRGVGSPIFGLSLIFSLYFIFEATGLRQEIGNQAKVLNEIVEIVRQTHHIDSEKVRELIGHTWAEVFGGLALGFLIALLVY